MTNGEGADSCPRHCYDDRQALHDAIRELKVDRKERWEKFSVTVKWFIGILVVVLIAVLGVLYRGQSANADKIISAQQSHTVEMKSVAKELTELKVIVTRIDERTKKNPKTYREGG